VFEGNTYGGKPLKVTPLLGREFRCVLGCAGCCPRFSLDYLPDEAKPDIPLTRRDIVVSDITYPIFSYLQNAMVDNWHCDLVDRTTGACTIHGRQPFSSDFETVRFFQFMDHAVVSHAVVRTAPFGRAWNLKRIDGNRGALCEFGAATEQSRMEAARRLKRLAQWCEYFQIEHRIPQMLDYLDQDRDDAIIIQPLTISSPAGQTEQPGLTQTSDPDTTLPDSDIEYRKAQLEYELREIHADIEALEGHIARKSVEAVEKRVQAGVRLIELDPRGGGIIPRGEWVRYLDSGVLPFKRRTAYDYIDTAYLHQNRFEFAMIANLRVREIRREAHRLRDTLHNARSAERRQTEIDDRTRQLAELINSRWDRHERRQSAALITAGVDAALLLEYLLAARHYRTELLPESERGRGLTRLMLDSGAYSAFTQNVTIDIEKYIEFLLDNRWITNYVNLDVIIPNDPDEAAHIGFANFEKMRSRGLDPIPVFHVREGFNYLQDYLALGCPTIGLSATPPSARETMDFYERSFEIIQRSGQTVRVHAFGDSSRRHLKAFPFASTDSFTWLRRSLGLAITNISPLGDVGDLTEQEKLAARVYIEGLRAHRLEQEIRETRPDFDFYLVIRAGNPYCFPGLAAVRHYKALASFYYSQTPAEINLLKQFIEQPQVVLAEERYAAIIAQLEMVRRLFN
jgi:hypothetical protein